MWRHPFVLPLLALAVGCGHEFRPLEREMKHLTLPGAERIAECSESGALGIDYPGFDCDLFVAGTQSSVTLALADRLERAGYVVKCRWERRIVTMQAGRGSLDVYADISPRGSAIAVQDGEPLGIVAPGDFSSLSNRRAPTGSVIVKLSVADYGRYRWPDASWPDCNRAFFERG